MKLKVNDKVIIIKGKDNGKIGKIERVLPKTDKIVVANANVYKKSLKPSQQNPQGGVSNINVPINSSNVKLICPQCSKATKVLYKTTEKEKIRICKQCGESVDVK